MTIGTTTAGTSLFLADIAAPLADGEIGTSPDPAAADWIHIPIARGHVEVFDATEVGVPGLVITTYDPHARPTGVQDVGWICERATVEDAV